MPTPKRPLAISILLQLLLAISAASQIDPPTSFDLRDVDGNCYVTPVKSKACSS